MAKDIEEGTVVAQENRASIAYEGHEVLRVPGERRGLSRCEQSGCSTNGEKER